MIVQSSKQPYTLEILQQPYKNPANIKGCYKLLMASLKFVDY